jgi:hypothetical protein
MADIINSINSGNPSGKYVPPSDDKDKKDNQQTEVAAIELAYLSIFNSIQTKQDTSHILAKDMQNKAATADNLIRQEAQLHFVTLPEMNDKQLAQKVISALHLPNADQLNQLVQDGVVKFDNLDPKATQAMLSDMESQNMKVSAIRSVLEDQIGMVRQSSQVAATNLNSIVCESQQSIQEDGNLMQMLASLSNQISRI